MASSIYKLPMLYSIRESGKKQIWSISVLDSTMITEYGQENGKFQRIEKTSIPKNIGKKNETTGHDQAILEATSAWTKKKKAGYQEQSSQDSEIDSTDTKHEDNVSDDIKPMLACDMKNKSFDSVSFPIYIQPKLDGIRMMARNSSDDELVLLSRRKTTIPFMAHIRKQLLELYKRYGKTTIMLDGELYVHGMKLQEITPMVSVNRKQPHPNEHIIQYHIFDIIDTEISFSKRLAMLLDLKKIIEEHKLHTLIIVETEHVTSGHAIQELYESYMLREYEGLMIRYDVPYEMKRTKYLLKYKQFITEEATITGYSVGRGKEKDVIFFTIKDMRGNVMENLRPRGTFEQRKYLLENNPDQLIGKEVTIQYQELSIDNIPRFPVVLAIRDYE